VEPTSGAAIVMEQETGTILYAKNVDTAYYPASITKILTGYLAVENCQLDEVVTFSEEAVYGCESGSSSIARDVGEEMTLEQCLYGMMLESANECAYAIAEHVSGDLDSFVALMNETAAELGCKNTHFSNANGLPDEEHYTTAYDFALIARAAYSNKTFATIMGTKTYTIPPTNKHEEETLLNNHHAMLNYYKTSQYLYDYCTGGKTGYTEAANSTLVTYAEKDGMTLVCVVMNAESPAHYVDTRTLFDYCFDNFTVLNVSENANLYTNSSSWNTGALGVSEEFVSIDSDGVVVLPKTADIADCTLTVEPVSGEEGVIGRLVYTYGEHEVGGANILYTADADASSDADSSDASGDSSSSADSDLSDTSTAYPFHNLSEEEGGSSLKYFRINIVFILFVIALAVVLFFLIKILRKKLGKLRIRRNRKSREERPRSKDRYRKIDRSRRRRNRRRR